MFRGGVADRPAVGQRRWALSRVAGGVLTVGDRCAVPTTAWAHQLGPFQSTVRVRCQTALTSPTSIKGRPLLQGSSRTEGHEGGVQSRAASFSVHPPPSSGGCNVQLPGLRARNAREAPQAAVWADCYWSSMRGVPPGQTIRHPRSNTLDGPPPPHRPHTEGSL